MEMGSIGRTIAEETMQLVASEEGQPADTVSLVFAELDADVDWNRVFGDLASVE